MRTVFNSLLLLSFSTISFAQQGTISIEQDPKIDALVQIYKASSDIADVYRIQVFFGSLNDAKDIKMKTEGDYPDWYSKIDFISPSYRVRIGQFKTKLDAERNLIDVRKKYPSAMLIQPEKKQS
ncbi:SPOR domain-containing protein [Flavobacteriaceae bacterium KMM 6897]|nr:SPOR domain-containing protein [Flavobacteriaceae bacterium KMM 6897]MEB8346820.1 SPOR domain-containing protein [Flavobacteriaceae bacterium KMM 6898]